MQMSWRPTSVWAAVLVLGQALGCSSGEASSDAARGEPSSVASPPSVSQAASARPLPAATTSSEPEATEPRGDVERGKALVAEHECARCHDGLDEVPQIANTSHCSKCHQDVLDGKYDHKPDHARWKQNVAHLAAVPSLAAAGRRLRYPWLVEYLQNPHDLRPNLVYNMPRLALDRQAARDIASYLTSLDDPPSEALELSGADLAAGKRLLTDKGCGSCHTMSRTDTFAAAPKQDTSELRVAVMLAPDLRHARERLRPDAILAWLRDPLAMKPGTLMPQTPMSAEEAKNIVAYLMQAPLAPAPPPKVPDVPKPLDREVKFQEVDEVVFAKICRHCHGNPDEAIGDGGPGNTGGFGFKARGLELTSYKRVMAGYLDDQGERQSVFSKMKDGTPRLIASLMARHAEEAGTVNPEIRGMPLGLPPLPLEDIQLLVTWIAQGRKR